MTSRLCLLIDAGNTRIKWVLWDGATPQDMHVQPLRMAPRWLARGDCLTREPGVLRAQWVKALTPFAASPAGPVLDAAVYCSVAGESVNAAIESAFQPALDAAGAPDPAVLLRTPVRRFNAQPLVGTLRCAYQRPSQLGADRFAAALGAWARVQGDALVVCAGTATTVDLLQLGSAAQGQFSGGIILPGLDMMLSSLSRQTAQLPDARGQWQTAPKNTDDAIISGCLNAQIGAVERMRAQLPAAAPCLLAGGAGERLLPFVAAPVIHAPDLVLEGLVAAILHGFQP